MDEPRIHEFTTQVDGRPVRGLEAGEGAPMVLLPSVFINADVYRPTLRALAGRFRVRAVDVPGSGGSEPPDRRWGFEDFADWVPRLLDALGLPTAPVIGHSYTAAVAMLADARHPGRLSGLVLAGAVAVRPRSLAGLAFGLLRSMPLEPRFGVRSGPAIGWNLVGHPKTFFCQLAEMAGADLSDAAARVQAPTLIAWGLHDHIVPLADAQKLHTLIDDSRLELSSGSHDWLVTRPGEFAEAVIRFGERRGWLGADGRARMTDAR